MFEPYNNKKLLELDCIKKKLFNDFKNRNLHHSLIFVGNNGIGKATLCYHLANKILDYETNLKSNAPTSLFRDIPEENVLDDNNQTYNLIKNKKHPDLLVIEREFDQKTSKIDKEIKVSSARKILDFISLAPFASKSKVIIIDSIDEMNNSAQNAILKILEEPIKNTYIFLVCHNINNVLETILSRCRRIDVKKYNFNKWQIIMNYIYENEYKNLTEDQKNTLYNISNGSISLAISIIKENGLSLYEYIENLLSAKQIDIESLHSFADKLANDEKLYLLFEKFIQLILYQTLKCFLNIDTDENFKNKNYNFILKNNEEILFKKINFAKKILRDINIFNLNKKHAVIVLFNKLFNNDV